MAELGDVPLARVLAFTTEVRGRPCCRSWSDYLRESLSLDHQIRLNKAAHDQGVLYYHHSAVRELGHEFEECVTYQFEFHADKEYRMQWTRTFDGWTSQNERQVGAWRVVGDRVCCETLEGPAAGRDCVRYAAAGLAFEVPVEHVLAGHSAADDRAPAWEYLARGLPVPAAAESALACPAAEPEPVRLAAAAPAPREVLRPDARFVEVDGEMHEVCADIKEHWPEADWPRMMRCRVRFGIYGPV